MVYYEYHKLYEELLQSNVDASIHLALEVFKSQLERNLEHGLNPDINKKDFMHPFYGQGSTVSRLEPLRRGSLLFTTKFPEIPGNHFIDLGRMKGLVKLEATQWFSTWDPWIGNPAP